MIKLSRTVKQWVDFSASSEMPLFWMLLGPILVMLTLIVSLPFLSNPFLPLITVMGLVVSWRFRVSGFSLTLLVFMLYFGFQFLFGSGDAFLWKLGWGLSLALGLTISFLAMEELRSYYFGQKETKEKSISDLKVALHSLEEKSASEKRLLEREQEGIKEELERAKEEMTSLFNLVEASRIEAEKSFKQNQSLSQDSLSYHREKVVLEQSLREAQDKIDNVEKSNLNLVADAKKNLKALNTYRVELYQAQILLDEYIQQFKKFREVILQQRDRLKAQASEKPTKPQASPVKPVSRGQSLILQTLEKDKGKIKEIYDQHLAEYQLLKSEIEKAKVKVSKIEDEEEVTLVMSEIQKTERRLKDKKLQLEKTKSELIGIEREIFVIKKGMQEKGVPALTS